MSSMGGGGGAGVGRGAGIDLNTGRGLPPHEQQQQGGRPPTSTDPQHQMTFQIPQSAYAAPISGSKSTPATYAPPHNATVNPIPNQVPSPSQPLAYTPPNTTNATPFDSGGDDFVDEEDFIPHGEDPMWAEEMFDADVEAMGEDEMGGGMMMSGSVGGGPGQWREEPSSSPGTSPSHATLALPLSSDSPAIPSRGDDFGTVHSAGTANTNASTYGSSYDANALHNLLPTLGVSQQAQGQGLAQGQNQHQSSPRSSSVQSMPRAIPQAQGANMLAPMGSYNQQLGQPTGPTQIHSPTSSSSLSGSLPKTASTATHPTPHYPFAGVAPGSSPPDLRRQAGISAALASSNRAGGSPTLSMSPGSSVQRPSPLGQHYLAQNDPQHISKQPMGSIQFGAMHQPLFPTMAPLRNPVEASPTLSMEPEEKLTDYDAFGDGSHGRQALFPSMSMVTGGQSLQLGQIKTVQPQQVPLPPSPAMGFYSTASPPVRVSQDFGSPGVRVTRNFEEPSMAPTRPRMRQSTDDSFASTSSEEEDISSPMILGDVQMGRKSAGSPLTGVSPRGNLATGFSPRSNVIGSMAASGSASSSMFPDLRKVQDLAKMRSPIPAGGAGLPFGRGSFSFQPGKSAPVFPPMSTSSSSSDGFDDSDDDTMAGAGSEEHHSARRYAPMGRAQHSASGNRQGEYVDGGDGRGGRYGDGDDRPAMPRSASITIGGSGYSDEHFRDDGRNGGGSDGEPPKPPGRGDNRGRLEGAPARKIKTKKSRSRSTSRAVEPVEHDVGPSDNVIERDPMLDRPDEDRGDEADDDEDGGSDDGGEDFKGKKRKSTGKAPGTADSKAKRRKSTVQEQGNVTCDYVDPLPPHDKCDSRFHRVYDEQRHQATIHARDEGRAVRAGKLDEKDAKLWVQYGRPQVEWICSCGQVFSRKDAMMRHQHTRKHTGEQAGERVETS